MIGRLWRTHRLLLVGFVAMLALSLFFATRTMQWALYWSDHRDETVAGWMTPRYVAMSWDVPPEVVAEALGLTRDGMGRRLTLTEIAAAKGVPVGELAAALDAAIADYRTRP